MSGGVARSLWPDPDALGLTTDLYQLTMMAGHRRAGLSGARAVFEMFARRLPADRGYLVFAGLEPALRDLLALRIDEEQIRYLRGLEMFRGVDSDWFDGLGELRFRGDVWAVPEGTVVFADEPLLRVEGSLSEAQWVESYLLAALAYPTLVATKAARVVDAARGRGAFDFGMRRAHGPLAGYHAARSSYLSGFEGTSHVDAARLLGIPVVGTMAHAWIQAFGDEREAFRAFQELFPGGTTLLIDTYDTRRGAEIAAEVEGPVRAVRLDSGDLLELSRDVRRILDAKGRPEIRILASGDLDEYRIEELLTAGAPIDGFGVGTELVTGGDAPRLGMVYKLVELNGEGRVKNSPGKRTRPHAKQIFRERDGSGRFVRDVVAGAGEESAGRIRGAPLLRRVVRAGELVIDPPSLDAIRARAAEERASLPESIRRLRGPETARVEFDEGIEAAARRIGGGGGGGSGSGGP